MADEWDQYKTPAKGAATAAPATGGDEWDQYKAKPASAAAPMTAKPTQATAKPSGMDQAASMAGGFASQGLANLNPINQVSGLVDAVRHPVDNVLRTPEMANFRTQAGKDFSSGNYLDAASHTIAGNLPVLGPMLGHSVDAMNSGNPEAMGRSLADFASYKAVPRLTEGIGNAIKAPAAPIAEQALGVRNVDRTFHRNPGQAILEETRGVRPETIAKSAEGKVKGYTNELENSVNSSTTPVDMQPSRDVVEQARNKAVRQNSLPTVNELNPMSAHLEGNQFTGQKFGSHVPASQALDLKRGFGNDHVRFVEGRSGAANDAAKGAYGALDRSIDAAVPGSAELNDKISNLIPVANRAEAKTLAPGPLQNILGKFAKPTGALASTITGGWQGFAHGGLPGMIVGAAAGAGLPEVISSPMNQMIAARSLNRVGKTVASPAVKRAAQAGSLIGTRRMQAEQ